MMGRTSLVPVPPRNSYIQTPQAGLPYAQGSIPLSQPQLSYPQGSVQVPQPVLPYTQGSIPVANYAKSTIPRQSITQILPKLPGNGINRPHIYHASTYRNLGKNMSKYRNLNNNYMMGNSAKPGQYITRTYNARKL